MFYVALLGRAVPVLHTDAGLRAVGKDRKPVDSQPFLMVPDPLPNSGAVVVYVKG